MKLSYWRKIDGDPGQYTAQMAIGLGGDAPIRPLDPPHTQPNFVMREMGYSVARAHAAKLRTGVMAALFAAPAVLTLASLAVAPAFLLTLATIAAGVGVVIERWLFFAEAEHVSMLYYGADRA
jgi:DMSO reductase anchor subunit